MQETRLIYLWVPLWLCSKKKSNLSLSVYWGKPFTLELLDYYKPNPKQEEYTCVVASCSIHKALYFHSFLIDMFFSLSFCITWWKEKGVASVDRSQNGNNINWSVVLVLMLLYKPLLQPFQSPPGWRELSSLSERTSLPLCKHPEMHRLGHYIVYFICQPTSAD